MQNKGQWNIFIEIKFHQKIVSIEDIQNLLPWNEGEILITFNYSTTLANVFKRLIILAY